MVRPVLAAILVALTALPALAQPVAPATAGQRMQPLLNAPAVPIVGTDGRSGPHMDGKASWGYHGSHGWAPGTTCPTGTTITPFGTCVRL